MKLSAKLVLHLLAKEVTLFTSPSLSTVPILKYPVIFEPDREVHDGLIYIVDEKNFVLPSHHLTDVLYIFLPGRSHPDIFGLPNLCVISDNISAAKLLDKLQAIFQRFSDWNQEAFSLIYSNGTVQELLDLADKILPNPMMVHNQNYLVLGYTKMNLDNLKNGIYGSTPQTYEKINRMKQDPDFQALQTSTDCWHYYSRHGESMGVNIRLFDHFQARLVVTKGDLPLDNTISFLIEYLGSMLAHILSIQSMVKKDAEPLLHQIFEKMLSDPGTDYVSASQQLSELGWSTDARYLCVVIKTGTLDWENMTLRSICTYIENVIPGSCAVEYRGNAVAFINLALCTKDLSTINRILAEFVRDSLLTAGYSRILHGHFNFRRQYTQAIRTIELGSVQNPTAWIHHFDDVSMQYILNQITGRLPAYMIAHPRLLDLKYGDAGSGGHLFETLRVFLENQQSATKTAAALYIHRSTLLYRLEKIREIMKSDFSDPAEVLYILISYSILEQEG